MTTNRPVVTGFYDPRTFSVAYVVHDPATLRAAIVDPVWEFDPNSGYTSTAFADRMLAYVREQNLKLDWILDTHPHADHFSAAPYLRAQTGATTAIGDHVVKIQRLWQEIYNLDDEALPADGSQWDKLFKQGEGFSLGEIGGHVLFSPGHTMASITYVIGDAAFVHDTLFQPDFGTARCDFPGGDARVMWRSIQEILALPDETRIFTGHDYQPGGREPQWESTVAQQKAENPHIKDMDEDSYVALRERRDSELGMPKLILFALQVNLRGGRLPARESNGISYLKVPVNTLAAYTPAGYTR